MRRHENLLTVELLNYGTDPRIPRMGDWEHHRGRIRGWCRELIRETSGYAVFESGLDGNGGEGEGVWMNARQRKRRPGWAPVTSVGRKSSTPQVHIVEWSIISWAVWPSLSLSTIFLTVSLHTRPKVKSQTRMKSPSHHSVSNLKRANRRYCAPCHKHYSIYSNHGIESSCDLLPSGENIQTGPFFPENQKERKQTTLQIHKPNLNEDNNSQNQTLIRINTTQSPTSKQLASQYTTNSQDVIQTFIPLPLPLKYPIFTPSNTTASQPPGPRSRKSFFVRFYTISSMFALRSSLLIKDIYI